MLSRRQIQPINLKLGGLYPQVGASKRKAPTDNILKTMVNGGLGGLGGLFRPLRTRACARTRTIGMIRKKAPKAPKPPNAMEKQMLMHGGLGGDLKMKAPQGPHAPIG